ncbi:MAG: type II secretion system protein [Rhodocyclaceae bacterium]|nr:type II secretion system protein [Rhodocyclaceae bacterium]
MHKRMSGFTIFELVIVLIMIGILTAGMMPLLRTQHTRTMEDANRQALNVARDVVVSYALTNGGLPLPLTSAAATTKPEYVPTYPTGWDLTPPVNESYLPWDEHMVSVAVNLPPLGVPTFGSYRKYFWYDPRTELRNDYTINLVAGVPAACTTCYLPLFDQNGAGLDFTNPRSIARVSFCANVKTALKLTGTSDPRVCQVPNNAQMSDSCPGGAAAASPAALVIASFGNDRTPDKAHAAIDLLAATPVRNYENPARPVNHEHSAAPDIHYDDAVVSVSLAELASRCDQSGVACSADKRYLTIKNTQIVPSASLSYRIGAGVCTTVTVLINTRSSPGCLDSGATLWTDAACTTAFTAATVSAADSNGDGVASIWFAGGGVTRAW